MSWISTVRSLLRDLKRSSASTPSELQLEHLHVEADEYDGEIAWDNIIPIWDIIMSEKGQSSTFIMVVLLSDAETAQFHSRYVSSALVGWITALSQQAREKILVSRDHNLRIKNDVYSRGVTARITLSYCSADTVAAFPHDINKTTPFFSVLIRERHRPESSLTAAELYLILAMAAKHCTLPETKSISLRVLIVYSNWVQVLNVTTTVAYIMSIVNGEAVIKDKIIIHRTPWFNFLDAFGQLRTLLSAFDGITLEPKREPIPKSKKVLKTEMPLQEIELNASSQGSKRNLDSKGELENRRQKSHRVSRKEAKGCFSKGESLADH